MVILATLVPLAILGGLVWGIVAIVRRQTGEPLTLGTAIAAYAQLLIIVGVVMALSGLGPAVKAGLGYARLSYSYETNTIPIPFPGGPASTQQLQDQQEQERQRVQQQNQHDRDVDLVEGITLALIGAAIAGTHLLIAREARRLRNGAPAWITGGTLVVLTVIGALAGFIAAAVAAYRWLSYVFVAPVNGQARAAFGEPAGIAIAFLPLWLVTLLWLIRTGRQRAA